MSDLKFKQEYNRRLAGLKELGNDFICLDIFPDCNFTLSVQKTISSKIVVFNNHYSQCDECLSKVDRSIKQNYFTVFCNSCKTIKRIERIRKGTFYLHRNFAKEAFRIIRKELPCF